MLHLKSGKSEVLNGSELEEVVFHSFEAIYKKECTPYVVLLVVVSYKAYEPKVLVRSVCTSHPCNFQDM